MRNVSLAVVGGAVIIALAQGLASGVRAGAQDEGRPSSLRTPGPYRPWPGGFDVQVLVGGRPLPQDIVGGDRRVEAVRGAEYELRLTNPLPDRVVVAVSVDGLNVIDARHTTPWDASKWVIHPHGTLTLSGWQVGSERARRFYFTTERDAYATRIGRPGDFGVISAVFYRERHPLSEIIPRRMAVPERGDSVGEAARAPAAGAVARSDPRSRRWLGERAPDSLLALRDGQAATGIGHSVRSEVREVGMELERDPVAVVTLRYDFRPPVPRPARRTRVRPGASPGARMDDPTRGQSLRPRAVTSGPNRARLLVCWPTQRLSVPITDKNLAPISGLMRNRGMLFQRDPRRFFGRDRQTGQISAVCQQVPTLSGSILMILLHRRQTAESIVFALLFATFLVSTARADEPGFESIFNGKDLTGWRLGNTELAGKTASDDGRFAVKDGVLVITGSKDTPPKISEIDTLESYDGDFTLRLEFRASRNANSGLHLRDKAFAHQLQIRDYPRAGPYKALKRYKDGDWNAIEVIVTGTKARCTCNGELLESALAIPGNGPLALQSEINVIEYRKIRINRAETTLRRQRKPHA